MGLPAIGAIHPLIQWLLAGTGLGLGATYTVSDILKTTGGTFSEQQLAKLEKQKQINEALAMAMLTKEKARRSATERGDLREARADERAERGFQRMADRDMANLMATTSLAGGSINELMGLLEAPNQARVMQSMSRNSAMQDIATLTQLARANNSGGMF